MLDEIEDRIKHIHNEELKREVAYNFDNRAQHIHEWFRHNVSVAQ